MQNYYNDDMDGNFVYDAKNPADDLDPDVITTPTVPPVPKEEEALTMSKARNYQLEMLRESLKGNVIVVMDTGSGKTYVAVMRIQHEIDSGSNKICWFLCPGTALARQQFDVLQKTLSPVHMSFLIGSYGVDHWSNQETWDGVLGPKDQPSVIVSTHQILFDAISHGFVSMDRIGLLIFDEAHHCTASHPARRIMDYHYHPRRRKGEYVPSILGLTASPVTQAHPEKLKQIEAGLNAVARTPSINHEELMRYAHIPKLQIAYYGYDPFGDTLEMHVPSKTKNFSIRNIEPISSLPRRSLEIPKVITENTVVKPGWLQGGMHIDSLSEVSKPPAGDTSVQSTVSTSSFNIDIDLGGSFSADSFVSDSVLQAMNSSSNPSKAPLGTSHKRNSFDFEKTEPVASDPLAPKSDSNGPHHEQKVAKQNAFQSPSSPRVSSARGPETTKTLKPTRLSFSAGKKPVLPGKPTETTIGKPITQAKIESSEKDISKMNAIWEATQQSVYAKKLESQSYPKPAALTIQHAPVIRYSDSDSEDCEMLDPYTLQVIGIVKGRRSRRLEAEKDQTGKEDCSGKQERIDRGALLKATADSVYGPKPTAQALKQQKINPSMATVSGGQKITQSTLPMVPLTQSSKESALSSGSESSDEDSEFWDIDPVTKQLVKRAHNKQRFNQQTETKHVDAQAVYEATRPKPLSKALQQINPVLPTIKPFVSFGPTVESLKQDTNPMLPAIKPTPPLRLWDSDGEDEFITVNPAALFSSGKLSEDSNPLGASKPSERINMYPSGQSQKPKTPNLPKRIEDSDSEDEFYGVDPTTGALILMKKQNHVEAVQSGLKVGASNQKEAEKKDFLASSAFKPYVPKPVAKTSFSSDEDSDFSDIDKTGSAARVIEQAFCREDESSGDEFIDHKTLITKKSQGPCQTLASLCMVFESMEMDKDPYIIQLRNSQDPKKLREADKLVLSKKTRSYLQIKELKVKATHLWEEYGNWAAEWFIREAVRNYQKRDTFYDDIIDSEEDLEDEYLNDEEKIYTLSLLRKISLPVSLGPVEDGLSIKVEALIDILLTEYENERDKDNTAAFSGLVFVQQRAGTLALTEILKHHPRTKRIFKPGAMTGSSGFDKLLNFLDKSRNKRQQSTLQDFRTGKKNLIISTSVIEEGLDIQDCHLVVCFEPPTNLKSFVQRRGRARRKESSYIIMYPRGTTQTKSSDFEILEEQMKELYRDQSRQVDLDTELEYDDKDREEGHDKVYRIENTGAVLTMESSIPHLYHFCACLPPQEFVDLRPQFQTTKSVGMDARVSWEAEVVLPNSIHPDIRRFTTTKAWHTEKWAKRDVAFAACMKLHQLGQLDDNLMPLGKGDLQPMQEAQKRAPRAAVDGRDDIWESVNKCWSSATVAYANKIEMTFSSGQVSTLDILLPIKLPKIPELKLFWSTAETVRTRISQHARSVEITPELIKRARNATFRLIKNHHYRASADKLDYTYLFLPGEGSGETWDQFPNESIPALEAYKSGIEMGVIREHDDTGDGLGALYIFERWRHDLNPLDFSSKLEGELLKQPIMEVTKLTRRRDFLHESAGLGRKVDKVCHILPSHHRVDTLPWKYARLGLLLPFIVDRVEKTLLAASLRSYIKLDWLPIESLLCAITASSAQDPTDYQRLEFLGDSVLKMLASAALFDQNPLWHEGYLAGAKDKVVSNSTSSKAAVKARLSKWIITKPFTGTKWLPKYVSDPEASSQEKLLSSKVLADVVEALIGVAFLTRGFDGASSLIKFFDFGQSFVWNTMAFTVSSIVSQANENAKRFHGRAPHFEPLESFMGYSFKNKALLLEALTHLSHGGDLVSTSYQRLEFLGDALLDMVIVRRLYHNPVRVLSHIDMHHLKSACVNAYLLSFVCMDTNIEVPQAKADLKGRLQHKTVKTPLYKFIRAGSQTIPVADAQCYRRFLKVKDVIVHQLENAAEYPWTDLTRLDPPKHMSDIIESLIAAVWIDSNGNWRKIESFIEKLGILKVCDRLINEKVEADHPMSRFGKFAAGEGRHGTVKYHMTRIEKENGQIMYNCEVEVNGRSIVKVNGGNNSQHAKTWAAQLALGILEKEVAEQKRKAQDQSKEMKDDGEDEKDEEEEDEDMKEDEEDQDEDEEMNGGNADDEMKEDEENKDKDGEMNDDNVDKDEEIDKRKDMGGEKELDTEMSDAPATLTSLQKKEENDTSSMSKAPPAPLFSNPAPKQETGRGRIGIFKDRIEISMPNQFVLPPLSDISNDKFL